MIDYVAGKLAENTPTHVVVEVGGLGLLLHTPLSSYEGGRVVGERARFFAHLHVREDAMSLYGFATEDERVLFRLLIAVSGIGPPMAQKILSGISIGEFKQLVLVGDAKGLTRIKGIGQKTAYRLVLELKDRILDVGAKAESIDAVVGNGVAEEAIAALVGLGAHPGTAKRVVKQVVEDDDEDPAVETVIKAALRLI